LWVLEVYIVGFISVIFVTAICKEEKKRNVMGPEDGVFNGD